MSFSMNFVGLPTHKREKSSCLMLCNLSNFHMANDIDMIMFVHYNRLFTDYKGL